MPFEYEEFAANPHRMILAHSECISSRMQLECSWNTLGIFRCCHNVQNAFRMPYDCSSIAALIKPEVQLECTSNAVYECRQNVCGMAAEYGSSVQEFKQNATGIPIECTSNVTRMSQVYQEYDRNITR